MMLVMVMLYAGGDDALDNSACDACDEKAEASAVRTFARFRPPWLQQQKREDFFQLTMYINFCCGPIHNRNKLKSTESGKFY